jgi:hypothetical protein
MELLGFKFFSAWYFRPAAGGLQVSRGLSGGSSGSDGPAAERPAGIPAAFGEGGGLGGLFRGGPGRLFLRKKSVFKKLACLSTFSL